jgi:hypothetical protein
MAKTKETKINFNNNKIKIEIKEKSGKIDLFQGSCLETLSICQAMCCKIDWEIRITPEEYQAKLFETEVICMLTNKSCDTHNKDCVNKRYLLKRRENGTCIYLSADNKCMVHRNKPKTCLNFSCENGWRLNSTFPAEKKAKNTKIKIEKKNFINKIKDNFTFLIHPLLKKHRVLYIKEKNEIIFFKERIGSCSQYYTKDHYDNPKLTDAELNKIIQLFEQKITLREMVQAISEQFDFPLSKKEFGEILWLLNKHQIILESRNFAGMLSGTGGL